MFLTGAGASAKGKAASKPSYFSDDEKDVPETGSATSDDVDNLEFSVGGGGSDGDSFLNDDDMGGKNGKNQDSNEFSMSEQEISGSHAFDGFDYMTNALPPARRGSR